MTAIPRPAGLFPAAAPGTPLLGEIITWTCAGVTVKYADLIAALKEAGLDESVARELAPRHAFTRACKKLSDARITRSDTLERAAERIRQARFKVEAYSAYLAGETDKLDDALSAATARLREKVARIAAEREPAGAMTAPSLV